MGATDLSYSPNPSPTIPSLTKYLNLAITLSPSPANYSTPQCPYYRTLHFLFACHVHHHTPREAASIHISRHLSTLQTAHNAHIRACHETLVRELRGENASVWTCHVC
ncbi:uncharacterized protein CC84DRAFT_1168696 [Paraphaeosphaeria sporulosa]|uniref:Uncharacterized protein n=1 Tax=Paraphaeosphaeria sporulosa TaxID=1460663 RepID=A0A177BZH8_9PLEO|nr:uncharacterized protein CC84DRAFT_1168696 [Paraphaeosphaeria sporulosa]OAG00625.1 hypothetical protein CC84DRAFT_1168696 [Paraphaeosphaeria sporulosa]